MSFATIGFAAVGFLSPANRGSLMIALLLLFLLFGIVAGYFTARTHKAFGGTQWQRVTLITALAFPGFIFSVLLILNGAVATTGSANTVSMASMLTVLALWLLLSVPLVFAGAFYGFKADKLDFPTRVSTLPRAIPPQPWYLATPLVMAVGGILPFGTVFVELFFILTSLWMDQYYYVFGFLLLVWLLLVITCAEISIVLTYFALCAEDYKWWWRSALVPAASGCYLYAYCVYYFLVNLNMEGRVPQMLYFGYMGLVALAFSFVTGVTGYMASLFFTCGGAAPGARAARGASPCLLPPPPPSQTDDLQCRPCRLKLSLKVKFPFFFSPGREDASDKIFRMARPRGRTRVRRS
jgi:transmembrane 9 superfamily protein 2/4